MWVSAASHRETSADSQLDLKKLSVISNTCPRHPLISRFNQSKMLRKRKDENRVQQ